MINLPELRNLMTKYSASLLADETRLPIAVIRNTRSIKSGYVPSDMDAARIKRALDTLGADWIRGVK